MIISPDARVKESLEKRPRARGFRNMLWGTRTARLKKKKNLAGKVQQVGLDIRIFLPWLSNTIRWAHHYLDEIESRDLENDAAANMLVS